MKKILVIGGLLLAIAVSGFIGQAINVNATSKVELEELVQKQQITIDNLTSQLAEVNNQLSETTKRLEALESKENSTEGIETRLTHIEGILGQWDTEMSAIQLINDMETRFNKRVSLLEKINGIDNESIQNSINKLPESISNGIRGMISHELISCDFNSCTYPIQREVLYINNFSDMIGSFNYNILDYITVEEIKEIALTAYDQHKSEKINYKYLSLFINQPFNQPSVQIEIPLQ